MPKKERLKRLSLYGLDLREALHAMLSVDPRKLKFLQEMSKEERPRPKPKKQTRT
jgi:hypothetical protein